MSLFTLTAATVDGWWRMASKVGPYPEETACTVLATRVDLLKTAMGRTDKRKAPRPIAAALATLAARIPTAVNHWTEALQSSDKRSVAMETAPMALHRLTVLQDAIDRFPPDWLLDYDITVNELGWQVHARHIYPDVVAAWENAGRTAPKPHDDSPVCRFIFEALTHVGDPVQSAGAVAAELRRQMARGDLQTPE